MGEVVMHPSVSVDGFIADEGDQPGPVAEAVSTLRDATNTAVTRPILPGCRRSPGWRDRTGSPALPFAEKRFGRASENAW